MRTIATNELTAAAVIVAIAGCATRPAPIRLVNPTRLLVYPNALGGSHHPRGYQIEVRGRARRHGQAKESERDFVRRNYLAVPAFVVDRVESFRDARDAEWGLTHTFPSGVSRYGPTMPHVPNLGDQSTARVAHPDSVFVNQVGIYILTRVGRYVAILAGWAYIPHTPFYEKPPSPGSRARAAREAVNLQREIAQYLIPRTREQARLLRARARQ